MDDVFNPVLVQGIFERFDRDRSGKIDGTELRDALHSLGYLVPPSVLQVLISRYDDGSGRRVELNFDSFVEYGFPTSKFYCFRSSFKLFKVCIPIS